MNNENENHKKYIQQSYEFTWDFEDTDMYINKFDSEHHSRDPNLWATVNKGDFLDPAGVRSPGQPYTR